MKKTLILSLIFLAALSCGKKDPNAQREDIIDVFDSLDSLKTGTPLERTWVSMLGGPRTYYVRTSASFQAKWEDGGRDWATVSTPERIGDNLWKLDITAKPLSTRTLLEGESICQKRFGVLMLTASSAYLGTYIKVEQGMEVRRYDDFSVLTGSLEPNATHNDLLMSRWNATQAGLGYTSTVLPGQEKAWVYSKDGYVKLGSDHGVGADLITPPVPQLQNDTLLVVTFSAVVQNGDVLPDFEGGTEPILPMSPGVTKAAVPATAGADTPSLTVRVTGGGCIRDFLEEGGTGITFNDIPTYDRQSSRYPADIFEGARYIVFIKGTDVSPISVNTRIHFEAGNMNGEAGEKCNRVFIDDICIYRVDRRDDEDIFPIVGHSGKDEVL